MAERIDVRRVVPEAARALGGVQRVVEQSALPRRLLELVRMRASQLNGCAYCLDMHSKDARALGEAEQRLYLLDAWRGAPCYSERERAALGWAEALTRLAVGQAPDAAYERVRAQFSERETAELTLAIIAINSWNRLAIGLRQVPGHYQSRLSPEADAAGRGPERVTM